MLVRREVTQPWRAVEELEFMIVSWRCRPLFVQSVKVVLLLLSCQAHRQFILLKSTSTFAKSLPPGFLRPKVPQRFYPSEPAQESNALDLRATTTKHRQTQHNQPTSIHLNPTT